MDPSGLAHDSTINVYYLCGIFYFPWERENGSATFSVSPERHMQSVVTEIAQVSKRQEVASSPGPLDRESDAQSK